MRRKVGFLLVWGLVVFLLWLALKDVSWHDLGTLLSRLQAVQILVLLLVNSLIILLLGARWWLILQVQGHRIPFLAAAGYRLAAFSVSYLTPGPQFGGEPLQAMLARRRHELPESQVYASIGLDKLLELCSNSAFLAFGVVILVNGGLIGGRLGITSLAFSIFLLLFPLGYLAAIAVGKAPLSRLMPAVPDSAPTSSWRRAAVLVRASEKEAVDFVSAHKVAFGFAVLLSGVVWFALIFEYSLVLQFLGVQLNLWQLISIMTGAQIAILLPVPAGLGALESALVFMSQLVGEAAVLGAGISLLIRARDLLFCLLGLGLGGAWTLPRSKISFDPP